MTATIHSADDVRRLIRDKCNEAGSQRQFAVNVGVSQAYLSLVISGQREPGEAILAALGLARTVGYRAR
jgi:DNA-binding transcriptional regulator YdaS (Cro superfamily)